MKVKDLITELQKLNPEEEVFVKTDMYEETHLDTLQVEVNEGEVLIHAEPPPTL